MNTLFLPRPRRNARHLTTAVLALVAAAHLPAQAHGNAAHPASAASAAAAEIRMEQKPWGIAGRPQAVTRTIEVRMTDTMRFSPDRIEVREGETVRLVHRNRGKVLHEFVLGTADELAAHAALMRKFPNMEHDEPYMSHVAAGGRNQIVWQFNRAGEFEFACLVPGHYEAGMVGKVIVRPQ